MVIDQKKTKNSKQKAIETIILSLIINFNKIKNEDFIQEERKSYRYFENALKIIQLHWKHHKTLPLHLSNELIPLFNKILLDLEAVVYLYEDNTSAQNLQTLKALKSAIKYFISYLR